MASCAAFRLIFWKAGWTTASIPIVRRLLKAARTGGPSARRRVSAMPRARRRAGRRPRTGRSADSRFPWNSRIDSASSEMAAPTLPSGPRTASCSKQRLPVFLRHRLSRCRIPKRCATSTWPQQRDSLREVVLIGPRRTRILVGRSIERDTAALARLAWQIALTGAGVLAVGLAGGWFLSRGVIRPIETMSQAASAISVANLTQRIDVREMDSELGGLARILNDAFGRLEAAFRQQSRFTADASHELRTPLSIIHTHLELALTKPRSAEEYREAIETCLRASQRMKTLVDGLLTLARADAGKLELEPQKVDLESARQGIRGAEWAAGASEGNPSFSPRAARFLPRRPGASHES